MSIFDIPTANNAEIMADIKKRMANSQTVTDDELRRITGSTEPQVIMPLKLLTKLLEQSAESKNNRRQLSEVAKALNWQPPYQASLAKRAEQLIESNDALQEERSRLKERVKELEEGIARCRQQASYCIGNEEALKNQLSKVRDIANEVLMKY